MPSCWGTSTSSSAGGRSTSTAEALADALVTVCDSPLGPLAGPGATLREIPLADRLREMDFELPLAGGDVRGLAADVRLGDLAPLLRRHLSDDDPVAAYADALVGELAEQSLRGYLTGSVDVVLRRQPGRATWSSTTRPTGSVRSTSR